MSQISVWFILEISQLPLVAAGKGNVKQFNHHQFLWNIWSCKFAYWKATKSIHPKMKSSSCRQVSAGGQWTSVRMPTVKMLRLYIFSFRFFLFSLCFLFVFKFNSFFFWTRHYQCVLIKHPIRWMSSCGLHWGYSNDDHSALRGPLESSLATKVFTTFVT